MSRKIVVIDGHPDPDAARFGHALAKAYQDGAHNGGHEARLISLANSSINPLRSAADFAVPPAETDIVSARAAIEWADHLVIIFPLWLGTMPALVKAFFEQVARAQFALGPGGQGRMRGKSARIIVTMGMPSLIFRTMFGGHGVKCLQAGILGIAGVRPVRVSLFGMIEAMKVEARHKLLASVEGFGRLGV